MLDFFKRREKSSRLLKKYAEIDKLRVTGIDRLISVNNFPDLKVLMKVIETETFNVDFTSQ